MNYLKWKDFNPETYKEMHEKFKPAFFEILPHQSNNCFKYHMPRYQFKFMSNNEYGLKETIEEELDRFKSYLIYTYNLN
jgi:hypothetical protein